MMHRHLFILLLAALSSSVFADEESRCVGTTSNGKLINGVQLPSKGGNFKSYSLLAGLLGRTYVHSKVRDVISESYSILAKEFPDRKYKYAETGYRGGGKFNPHKTHQNGLSVDFTVPVLDENNKSVYLPTNIFNKWGYNIEFDNTGKYDNLTIDFESLAAHIVTLHKVARKHGIGIWRVIFAPELQPFLYKTKYGKYIKDNILIPKKKSWVRHDDHYHVDFSIKCETLRR